MRWLFCWFWEEEGERSEMEVVDGEMWSKVVIVMSNMENLDFGGVDERF